MKTTTVTITIPEDDYIFLCYVLIFSKERSKAMQEKTMAARINELYGKVSSGAQFKREEL